jgi:anti-sigma factor RsiW
MTCTDFETRLSAYLDGELSHWKRWKVQLHLRCCPACARVLRDLQEVDQCFLVSAEALPEAEYLTSAVMRRLPAMPPSRMRFGSRTWATGLALAGMQLVALCGAYWWGYTHGSGAPLTGAIGVSAPGGFLRPSRNPRGTAMPSASTSPGAPLWSRTAPDAAPVVPVAEVKPEPRRHVPAANRPALKPRFQLNGAH